MTLSLTKPRARGFASGLLLASAVLSVLAQPSQAAEPELRLSLRRLVESPPASNQWQVLEQRTVWSSARTAVVVCDMWDRHWCQGASARVAEMAPRMNQVLNALRDRGVLIIHCPSETMGFYRSHPGRLLAQSVPKVDVKAQLLACATRVRQTDPPHPIDASDGGCDCQPACRIGPMPPFPWSRQIATLEIKEGDAITDNVEAYSLMRQRGITNVIVLGVHENMCVLNRAFAIKQMVKLGQNVALVRDLTDTMYNSRRRPNVDHFTGNDLMTWHIENYWCPTFTSDQIVGGQPFRFAADTKPPRVFRNEPAPAPSDRSAPPPPKSAKVDATQERQAAQAAEVRGDWDAALLHYETLYDSTPTDPATRTNLWRKFGELRPKVAANTDPAKAGVWRVRAYVFRELDFQWKDRKGTNHHTFHRYRPDELARLERGMKGFAGYAWAFSRGQLRIDWQLTVLDSPLTKLDGGHSFWPGPDSCMPHLTNLHRGDTDTIMVFAKAYGSRSRGETNPPVPEMLLGGAFGSLGDLTKHATYIGFNWGSGTADNEPDGEPMMHEWLHSVQWTLEDYQGYPRGLMATSDGGRMEGETGGDPCYRRRKDETSWMRFYEHILTEHVTRKMLRELSVTRPPDSPWKRPVAPE